MYLKVVSFLIGLLSRVTIPTPLRQSCYNLYISKYSIDTKDLTKELDDYKNFQEFFTREVKNREIDNSLIVSPVDCSVVDFGEIKEEIKVKNISYYLDDLLCSKSLADDYRNGSFLTLYLSPSDYHRIHSPVDGKVTEWIGKAGQLKTVNPEKSTIEVLATNERVVSIIEHDLLGKIALIKVGALNVGSIHLNYLNLDLGNHLFKDVYPKKISKVDHDIQIGEEIARFNLGSTVVMCLEKNIIDSKHLKKGMKLKMGQSIPIM